MLLYSFSYQFPESLHCINNLISGVSPSGSDTKVATYPTEGTRTIKITAKSTMETIVTTKDIICQLKITEDPVVTSNHPQNFNLGIYY